MRVERGLLDILFNQVQFYQFHPKPKHQRGWLEMSVCRQEQHLIWGLMWLVKHIVLLSFPQNGFDTNRLDIGTIFVPETAKFPRVLGRDQHMPRCNESCLQK